MANDELKPCPFCGGDASIGNGLKGHDGDYYFVNCTDCLASTNLLIVEGNELTRDAAIAAWNTRAPGWLPIESAPKNHTPVDLWSPSDGRLTNYVRFDHHGDGRNIYYMPVDSGPAVIRDATHWQPLPEPPK